MLQSKFSAAIYNSLYNVTDSYCYYSLITVAARIDSEIGIHE
jgi:hypothetical protein